MSKSSHRPRKKTAAQAMLEFALALPVLLLVVYGLLETGRLLFIYASVVTAARQAARYGSASGDVGTGTLYYNDCTGIRTAAKRVGFIQRFNDSDITIQYDTGPGSAIIGGCQTPTITDNLHRIRVTVSTQWTPIVRLVPFQAFTITSSSNRTILTGVPITVDQGAISVGGGGGQIQLVKDADRLTYSFAGDVIHYTYTIINPGSDPITAITLTDMVGSTTVPVDCSGLTDPLPGGNASTTCHSTYTATAAQAAAQAAIVNTATVTAFTTAGSPISAGATRTINFAAAPTLGLAKTGAEPIGVVAAGTVLDYTFTLTNTGNVPLSSPYTINDPLIGSNWNCTGAASPLAAGASITCIGHYTLRNTDVNNGFVNNTATATAKFNATTITSGPASAHVDTPKLGIALSSDRGSGNPVTRVGDVVQFTYTLTNHTASSMSSLKVSNSLGGSNLGCLNSLASGQSGSCTIAYTATQADLDGGPSLAVTATASAQGNVSSNQGGTLVAIAQTAGITLTKGVPAPGGSYVAGQQVTYTYTVGTAPGDNVTIRPTASQPITITDSDPRFALNPVCTIASGTLAPGGTLTCSKAFILTAEDIAAGSLTSTATASGTYGTSTALNATATATFIMYSGPRLALVKTPSRTTFTVAGDIITYSYGLQNTGGQVLTLSATYTLNDNKVSPISGPITCPGGQQIAVGAVLSCGSKPYTVTAADVTAGRVDNTLSVVAGSTATGSSGAAPVPGPITRTVNLLKCDAASLFSASSIAPGTNTSWDFTNSTGTALHVSGGWISWQPATGANLLHLILGATEIPNATGNPILTLPAGGWPDVSNGTTPRIILKFLSGASNIHVHLTFQESIGGTACSVDSP